MARQSESDARQLPRLAQINTVSVEKMSPAVLRGKQIFYNAATRA